MIVTKTNYGLLVTIPEQHDSNGDLLNSEFAYQLRQVRTINDNDPDEQPLINRLERKEQPLTRKFILLAWSMWNLFCKLNDNPRALMEWEGHNRMDFNRYYHDQLDELQEAITDICFKYAEHSKHGFCI